MNQTPPRDDDPSGMTDFEKNTASEELEQLEQEPQTPDRNRFREDRGDEKPDKQPGSGTPVRN